MGQEAADRVLDVLMRHGVNHLDTAASYGDSELRIAPWLRAHPGHFFLATKTDERTGAGARASLERSLDRLGVDRVDLIQLHNLVEEEEWETVHGPGGALEALISAREEGLVGFIGVTGHGLRIARMHLRSLERHDYDSVLFPLNFTLLRDDAYRRDVDELVARCEASQVAIQTIKSVARRRWPAAGEDAQRPHFSWYQPLEDQGAITRAVRFVLGRPGVFLNSSSDYRLLPTILEAAEGHWEPPTEAALEGDVAAFDEAPLFDGDQLERI
jgi:aryl-alcohol dehydrogenase-like predicted oxidoreductase